MDQSLHFSELKKEKIWNKGKFSNASCIFPRVCSFKLRTFYMHTINTMISNTGNKEAGSIKMTPSWYESSKLHAKLCYAVQRSGTAKCCIS